MMIRQGRGGRVGMVLLELLGLERGLGLCFWFGFWLSLLWLDC